MPTHIINTGDQAISGSFSANSLSGIDCSVENLNIKGFPIDQLYARAIGVGGRTHDTIIDPRSGWTANTAINGSTTSIGTGANTLRVNVAATTGSQAYIRNSTFHPEIFTYPGDTQPGGSAGINFDRPLYLGWMMTHTSGSNQPLLTSTEGYIRFGHLRTLATFGQLQSKGFGVYISDAKLFGAVHDGTNLNAGTQVLYDMAGWPYAVNLIEIISNVGTVYFYVNGVLKDTLSGGPLGFAGQEGTGTSISLKNNDNRAASLFIPNGRFVFKYLEVPSLQSLIEQDLGYNDLVYEFAMRGNELSQVGYFTGNTSGAGAVQSAYHTNGILAQITTTNASYAAAYFYENFHTSTGNSGAGMRLDQETEILLHGVMLRIEPNENWVTRINFGVGAPTRVVPLAGTDPAPNLRMWGVEFYYEAATNAYYGRLYWNNASATSTFGTPFLLPAGAAVISDPNAWFSLIYSIRLRSTGTGVIEIYMNNPVILRGGQRLSSLPLSTMSAVWTAGLTSGRYVNVEVAAKSDAAPSAGIAVRNRIMYARQSPIVST
jgi:hypothetical protein